MTQKTLKVAPALSAPAPHAKRRREKNSRLAKKSVAFGFGLCHTVCVSKRERLPAQVAERQAGDRGGRSGGQERWTAKRQAGLRLSPAPKQNGNGFHPPPAICVCMAQTAQGAKGHHDLAAESLLRTVCSLRGRGRGLGACDCHGHRPHTIFYFLKKVLSRPDTSYGFPV